MNTFRILIFSLLLTSAGTFAQSYYGKNHDLRDNSTPKPPTAEEIDKNRNEYIDKYMAKFKAAVDLEELQIIAIKNELITNSKNIDIIMKKEDSQEEKKNEVKALMDKTEVVVNSYLNKDQKEKYLLFRANLNKKTKEKKGKKEEKQTEE
jgi:N-methylhydantoinase A/oxoprolinase/acetone carboxylase beta subunit